MQKINNAENVLRIARYIKKNSSRFGRLNKVYSYCEENGLNATDINFVLKYINDRILVSI